MQSPKTLCRGYPYWIRTCNRNKVTVGNERSQCKNQSANKVRKTSKQRTRALRRRVD